MIVADFDVAAGDLQILRLAADGGDGKLPCSELAQQGGVAREDAHLAIEAGDLRGLRLHVEQELFGRRNLDLESIGHRSLAFLFHLFVGLEHVVDGALHVERLLRNFVVLAFDHFLERTDRVGYLHVLTLASGERFGDVEGLR